MTKLGTISTIAMCLGNEFNFLIVSSVIWLVFFQQPAHRFFTNLSCAKITSCFTLILLVCFQMAMLCSISECAKTFTVYWNTTNEMFRHGNSDRIMTVNEGNASAKFDYDQVNIICPDYSGEAGSENADAERYIVYNVSKEEYDVCRITNSNPRIIAVCDKPNKQLFYTITFRPFTPQPGGLEFPPGRDYYFISTSSKDDLHRRVGGRCSSNNMKVIFKVCCSGASQQSNSISGAAAIPPVFHHQPKSNATVSPFYRGTKPRPYNPVNVRPWSTSPPFVPTKNGLNKWSTVYHPNDVIQNGELSKSAAAAPSTGVLQNSFIYYLLAIFVVNLVHFLIR